MDKKAMVQTTQSKEWRPLKEVIAEVRVATKYAEREQRRAEEASRGRKKRGRRGDLPLVASPARTGDEPPATKDASEEDRISPEDALIGTPDIQTLADDPAGSRPTTPVENSAPIRMKPLEDEAAPAAVSTDEPIGVADEPVGVADEPIGVADEPIGVVDEPIGVVDEPSAPDPGPPAVVAPVVPPVAEPPHEEHNPFGDAFIDEEPPAAPTGEPAPVSPEATGDGQLSHPRPSEDDVSRLVDSLDSARVDDALIGAPPDIQTLADDPAAPPVTPGAGDDRVIPPAPVPPVEPSRPPDDAPAQSSPADTPVTPPEPPPVSVSAPDRIRVVVPDPVRRSTPPPPEPEVAAPASSPGGARPAAPDSPRESPVRRRPVTPPSRLDREDSFDGDSLDEGRGGVTATLLAAVGAVGAFLSRFLQPISRLERGEPIIDESAPPLVGPSLEKLRTTASDLAGDVRERVGGLVEGARSRRSETADSPAFTPEGADDEETPSRLVSTLQSLTTTLSSWGAAVTARIPGFGGESEDEDSTPVPLIPPDPRPDEAESSISPVSLRVEPLAASIEPEAPAPDEEAPPLPPPVAKPAPAPKPPPPVSVPAVKMPSTPVRPPVAPPPPAPAASPPPVSRPASAPRQVPPPHMDDMEVVPFIEPLPRAEPEDLYEGGVGAGVGDLLRSAWAWARLLGVIAIVAGGVTFAVVKWRNWFPTAAELGEATFTEVDRVARAGERAAEQQEAVERLSGQLPHLAPQTIRLILSRSTTGVLEARDVFAIAGDATDRGFGTLTAEEATELDALGVELHERLGPLEREQLRDYGLTRARRLVFVEEHGHAMVLVARGALAMPPEQRKRLQGLLAKAINAGLGPPPPR